MKQTTTQLILGSVILFLLVCTINWGNESESSTDFIEQNPSAVRATDSHSFETGARRASESTDLSPVEQAIFQEFVDHSSGDPRAMSPNHWGNPNAVNSPQFSQPIQQIPPMQSSSMPQYIGPGAGNVYPSTGGVAPQPIIVPSQPPIPTQQMAIPTMQTAIPTMQVSTSQPPIQSSGTNGSLPRHTPTSNPFFNSDDDHYSSPIETRGPMSSSSFSIQSDDDVPTKKIIDEAAGSLTEETVEKDPASQSIGNAESAPLPTGTPVPREVYPNQVIYPNNTPVQGFSNQVFHPNAPIQAHESVPVQGVSQYPIYNEDFENQNYPAHAPMQNHSLPMNTFVQNAPVYSFQPAPAASKGCQLCKNKNASAGFAGSQFSDSGQGFIPSFSPKASEGARSQFNTIRPQPYQSYEKFAFEDKEQFPKPGELLRSAVYFFDFELGVLQPHFQSNSAIAQTTGGFTSSESFDFDYDTAPRLRLGLESEYGPGFELDYFQFDQNSDLSTFTSDGTSVGATELYQLGTNQWTSIQATQAGEALNAKHSFELHSYAFSAFKALKFKRARIAGRFGLQYVQIQHELDARVFDAAGSEKSRLLGTSEFEGFGPRFGLDYFRPVGHTPLEFVTSATVSVLFGNQDQMVGNGFTGEFSSIGADEFVTTIDIFSGLQTRKMRGEKRSTFARFGYVNQSWFGGGTAGDPAGNFGLQGISFAVGVNR